MREPVLSEKRFCGRRTAVSGREKAFFPGVSIGISRIREGESLKEAFRRADIMLYQVKRQGKHGYRFYE